MDLKHKLERITANKDLLCTICHDKLSCKDSKKNCTESEDLITVLGKIALEYNRRKCSKEYYFTTVSIYLFTHT